MIPRILLAIDPGRATGWAYYHTGRLWCSGLIRPPFTRSPFAVCPEVAIIEKPRSYPHEPVDPNDLLKLQERASELAGLLLAQGAKVEYAYPRDWKGSLSKEICKARVEKRLTAEDNRPTTNDHNVWDAVGLGMWRVKRL